ncbi:hypothetical protein E3O19_15715 [Cryobacterium algoritolerans]|uniref:Sulfocyanin-like C-terminal domain-containing protein n=1 Tax=Cryobacterium algoritolerans TaxID=1259184 RepID=A0A4R8WJQ3_9MICO|nr:sulfocyanin-like copper-binding protein [Cryobacterium algoritolerans]TFC10443.1 hypothetical protein E3O19_15715 [Cryobacterium algoritolerans]
MRRKTTIATAIVSGVVAVVGLTGLSVSALTSDPTGGGIRSAVSSNSPQLPGTVVNVALMDMGGNMMGGGGNGMMGGGGNGMMGGGGNGMMGGGGNGMMGGGGAGTNSGAAMGLRLDRATAGKGTVSFLALNRGSISHELVVLPLSDTQTVGTRPGGGDNKVDETGSLGEASTTNGKGTGEGIAPGASSWVTMDLAPGRYEVLCNLPGHYAAGMYSELTVS